MTGQVAYASARRWLVRRTRPRSHREAVATGGLACVLAILLVGGVSVGCGDPKERAGAQLPPTPSPGGPPTPFPQYLAQTDADAVRIVSELAPNPGQNWASTGNERIANITSVQWVRSTIQGLNPYFPSFMRPEPQSGALPASTWSTPAWLFELKGDFHSLSRMGEGPLGHTLYLILTPNSPGALAIPAPSIDLSLLGTVHTIQRGESPGIDALRAPLAATSATIAVGGPSLTGNVVQVPGSTTGSGLAPYTAFNIHLRWDAAVFSFSSASNAGSVLPGSLSCPAAQVDADGAGVVYACTATGGASTTSAGLLATISLTPVATACSPLHLFTYGGVDAGDESTGTYTMDASTNIVVTATADGTSNQAGQVC
jgi:hypothetical protein